MYTAIVSTVDELTLDNWKTTGCVTAEFIHC